MKDTERIRTVLHDLYSARLPEAHDYNGDWPVYTLNFEPVTIAVYDKKTFLDAFNNLNKVMSDIESMTYELEFLRSMFEKRQSTESET